MWRPARLPLQRRCRARRRGRVRGPGSRGQEVRAGVRPAEPALIRHVSTSRHRPDLEHIRAALGDEKLTFLGLSYGTYIGALYAQQYPDRVRALVLDGAIDPALSIEQVSIEQSHGVRALARRVPRRLREASRAARSITAGSPRPAFNALRAKVDRRPIKGDDGQLLGPTQFDLAVASPLYEGADGYDDLAHSLREAEHGDPADDARELRRLRRAQGGRHLLAGVGRVPRDLVRRRSRARPVHVARARGARRGRRRRSSVSRRSASRSRARTGRSRR